MQDSDRTVGSNRTFGSSDSPTIGRSGDEEVPTLPAGTLLAGRYEVIQTLGVGGMGAVYKAFDRQLTRVVALKTILPELASSPTALKRFKQEVLLAQQIVHKNVVRIFDIGEDGATKFITMDFIEGQDLKNLVRDRGKFDPKDAVAIVREVCSALEAAHAAGVVHRDLKPQNIMVDSSGHVLVMDFGIAQSRQTKGATVTGSLVGTPDYMSPEQARSEDCDARSDIFSLGIIFYEMLTGKIPWHADSMLETMFKRTKERAVPPAEIDPSVPKAANDIIVKCLELEPAKRYQSFTEILADIENIDPSKKVAAVRLRSQVRKASRYWTLAAAGLAIVIIAAIAGYFARSNVAPKQAAAHAPMTVLIADFNNHTGDAVFDGALERTVKLALEGAGFISVYDRTQLRTIGSQPVSGRLDETAARQIAVSQGLGVVVSGALDRQGDGYTLSIKAIQAVTGNPIKIAEDTASKKDQVLFATTKLAGAVRKALGDDTSDAQLRFALETLSANSLEAVHEYSTAMEALSNGKHEEALKSFSKAVDVDQNFGLAYAGMATASRNIGQQQDAEKYVKLAVGHMDRMSERERYRTRGFYYLVLGNLQKCTEEYGTLIRDFPSDAGARNNIAYCWTLLRNWPKAIEEMRQTAMILPKRPLYRFNISVYASYGSDFQTGEKEAKALLNLDPSYSTGPNALALAEVGLGQFTEAADAFHKLEQFGALGVSDSRAGLADLAIYEGRFSEAAKILEQGAVEDRMNKYSDRAAAKYVALAFTRISQGQKGLAAAAAEKALESSKTFRIKFLAGRTLAAAGQTARAQKLAMELGNELQSEPQAYGKLIDGEIALASADSRKAIKAFTDGNNLMDTWIGRLELGRAYLADNQFAEADSEFDRCIKRRGEALALFLDESPTYGYFPQVYYYLGRVREGLNNPGFAESYRTYLSMREKAGEDPLIAEVRKRAK